MRRRADVSLRPASSILATGRNSAPLGRGLLPGGLLRRRLAATAALTAALAGQLDLRRLEAPRVVDAESFRDRLQLFRIRRGFTDDVLGTLRHEHWASPPLIARPVRHASRI